MLVSTGGQRLPVTFRFLINHPGCRPSSRMSAGRAADRDRQPASVADLTARQRELVTLRVAHLLEVETGFRGGDPLRPGPGEPRPRFDPAATTRTQRRQAKAAELATLDRDQARLLGLDRVGYRTLLRWEVRRRQFGVGDHSPNTLFAVAMAQGGFALEIPSPQLYYQLLPAHHVSIHAQRGVKVRGLWYDGPALEDYRHTPSGRGGRHRDRWVVRRDPRDARTVFFQDPKTHDWHPLRWTGPPPEGIVPAFSDARVRDRLAAARQAGLRPRMDAELLPVLLDLIGAHIPVEAWPTQMGKADRTVHAREARQAQAAATDRPDHPRPVSATPARPGDDGEGGESPSVTGSGVASAGAGQGWWRRARQAQQAMDDDRAQLRQRALAGQPVVPPPRLGEAFRRRNLFLLPADDEDDATLATDDTEVR